MWLRKNIKRKIDYLKSDIKEWLIDKSVLVINKSLNVVDYVILNAFIIRSAYESKKYFNVGDFYTVDSRTWCNVYDKNYYSEAKIVERIPTGEKFLVLDVTSKSPNSIILQILYKNQKGIVILDGESALMPWKFYRRL